MMCKIMTDKNEKVFVLVFIGLDKFHPQAAQLPDHNMYEMRQLHSWKPHTDITLSSKWATTKQLRAVMCLVLLKQIREWVQSSSVFRQACNSVLMEEWMIGGWSNASVSSSSKVWQNVNKGLWGWYYETECLKCGKKAQVMMMLISLSQVHSRVFWTRLNSEPVLSPGNNEGT